MRRRLLQAATAGVLIAASLGARIDPAHGIPYPFATITVEIPPPMTYLGPDEAIAATAPQIAPEPPPVPEPEPPRSEPVLAPAPSWPDDAGLYRLRMCESTDRYAVNTGNGYFGGYQFDRQTWDSVAGRHTPRLVGIRPDLAAPADQDTMVRALWAERGRQPWPVCGYRV